LKGKENPRMRRKQLCASLGKRTKKANVKKKKRK
jgi:hypothetical protein